MDAEAATLYRRRPRLSGDDGRRHRSWATSSAASCKPRCSNPIRSTTVNSANLIFGFAVTEALGIFGLLIALLLLFVRLN